MIKNLMIAVIVVLLAFVPILADQKNTKNTNHNEKTKCTTCQHEKISTQKISQLTLEELFTSKTVNLDFSNDKSVLVLLDKESIKNYNQVSNFSKWLEQKKLDVKVYTIINGENKTELQKLAKENNATYLLWDKSKQLSSYLKTDELPIAYYVVNGEILNSTEKIDVGHLKQLVWCQDCQKVKSKDCCKEKDIKNKDEMKKEKGKCTKDNCCGGNCNCGTNCKCK